MENNSKSEEVTGKQYVYFARYRICSLVLSPYPNREESKVIVLKKMIIDDTSKSELECTLSDMRKDNSYTKILSLSFLHQI